jgi:hypothetical protein
MNDKVRVLVLGLVIAAGGCSSMALGRAEGSGLATRWGETRQSPIREVSFERDAPERPVAVAVLYYDDGEGVRAQGVGTFPLPGEGMVDGAVAGGGALRVRLLDERGLSLPAFWRGDRVLVAGQRGQRYAIEISNGSPARIEAVATVDGLDVMDGGRGSFDKRGYVLRPGETYRVDGFRRSQLAVAAFRFGDVEESYAAQRGDDTNVGVIGVAFFTERGAPLDSRQDQAARRAGADPFPDRFAQPPPGAAW